jgi:hypothetical protein
MPGNGGSYFPIADDSFFSHPRFKFETQRICYEFMGKKYTGELNQAKIGDRSNKRQMEMLRVDM